MLIAAVWFLHRRGGRLDAGDLSARVQAPTADLYRLRFASSDRFFPGPSAPTSNRSQSEGIQTQLDIDVELSVERIRGSAPEEIRRVFRFPKCQRGSFKFNGSELITDRTACESELSHAALVVDYGPKGALLRVHEPKDAPRMFGELASFLVSEISFWSPSGSENAQTVTEANLRGVAVSHYERERSGDWIRRREQYNSLIAAEHSQVPVRARVGGRHRLRLEGDTVQDFVGAETVKVETVSGEKVATSLLRIELRRIGEGSKSDFDFAATAFTTRALDEPQFSEELERRMLVQQIDGLTREEFLATLARYAGSGRVPDHDRFLWRSYALLQLEPELARDMMPIFNGGNSAARTLVLDLLAQVGHPEAQAVVVELLQQREALADPKAVELHQRLGLIEEPEPETIDFAEHRYQEALQAGNTAWHFASAYTLGALARRTDAETSSRLREALIDDLDAAQEPFTIRHLVTALGAAQHEEDVTRIARYATSEDANVRAAVATTFDEPQTEDGLDTLLQLVADADRITQLQAIRSLHSYTLEHAHFEVVAARVSEGAIHQVNFRALVELAKTFRVKNPDGAEALLRAMVAFGIEDNQVSAAAHLLLRQSIAFSR